MTGPAGRPSKGERSARQDAADVLCRFLDAVDDVVPAYETFIHERPDEVAGILDTPVAQRADDFRIFRG